MTISTTSVRYSFSLAKSVKWQAVEQKRIRPKTRTIWKNDGSRGEKSVESHVYFRFYLSRFRQQGRTFRHQQMMLSCLQFNLDGLFFVMVEMATIEKGRSKGLRSFNGLPPTTMKGSPPVSLKKETTHNKVSLIFFSLSLSWLETS